MSFDAPGGLWLLAGIPVILVLWMLRPRRPRVRIPSVLLWPTSTAERRSAMPWQRLKNHPLLWLQVLIALLLALAAAQPFLPAEASDQRLIVLLDASGSMRATDVTPSRWDAARATATNLASSLGPDQTLSMLRVDDAPRILVADTRDASRVSAALAHEQPTFGPIDAAATVALAAGLTRGAPSEWVLIGDGAFPDLPSGVRPPPGTRFRFVAIGASDAANVALTGLTLRGNAAQVGIRNTGEAATTGSVELLNDSGVVVANSEWRAPAHQDAYVGFEGLPSGPAWFEAHLTSVSPPDANQLATDDRAWGVAAARGSDTQQRALLVTSGNTFLERILAVEGGLRTFKIPPTDWPALVSQGDAASYPLVVLDRQPQGHALGTPHDATPMPPAGSTLFIGGLSGDAFQPHLIVPVAEHPLLRNVDWSDVRVGRATQLTPDQLAGWQTIVDSDGGPLLLVRTMRDGDQVRRQALLTFELGESDLPLRSAFPVLMANLLDWLAPRPEGSPRAIAPGAALQLDASPLARGVRLESAQDASAPPEVLAPPWPPRPFHPTTPGVYRAVEDDPDSSVTTYVVADAFAPTEGDLRPQAPSALAREGDQTDGVGQVLRSVRSGLWPWLLAALLLLGAGEWLVDARGR